MLPYNQDMGNRQDPQTYPNLCFSDLSDSLNLLNSYCFCNWHQVAENGNVGIKGFYNSKEKFPPAHPAGTLVMLVFFKQIRKFWHTFNNGGLPENLFLPPAKRSCGKVMFLHLSVILFTAGVSFQGGLCQGDPPLYSTERVVRILLDEFLSIINKQPIYSYLKNNTIQIYFM